MSLAFTRLSFALFVAINFLLLSQSRYAVRRSLQGDQALAKRFLSSPHALNSLRLDKECDPLAYSLADQCAHVHDACPRSETLLSIQYLRIYFCANEGVRQVVFISLLIWVVFLFSTLGISASDFFTPNLATIAQILRLPENVAGVTLLAFGNGSPDVFSTYSAMRANSGSLAIGELLGAATFIVSCVVGSMCIIKPFRVYRGPFLRDVGFFTIAVSLLLVILWDHKILAWEAATLIGLYVCYVIVVLVGAWLERRREQRKLLMDTVRNEYQEDEPLSEPYRDDPSSSSSSTIALAVTPPTPFPQLEGGTAPPRPRLRTDNLSSSRYSNGTPSGSPSHTRLSSFSLLGAIEFRDFIRDMQASAASTSLSMFESPVAPFAGGRYRSHSSSRQQTPRTSLTSRDRDDWDQTLSAVALDNRSSHHTSSPASAEPGRMLDSLVSGYSERPGLSSQSSRTAIPSIIRTSASPTASEGDVDSQLFVPLTRWKKALNILMQIYRTLFPTLQRLRGQSRLGQVASILAAPAILLLTLTLPVVVTPYRSPTAALEKAHKDNGQLVDFEEEGEARVLVAEEEVIEEMHEMVYNKWLTSAQCALAPLFCVGVLSNGTTYQSRLLIGAAIAGLLAATLVAVFSKKQEHQTLRMARCVLGFVVSIIWIMAIADEVVNVLQAFGFIFGLSDAIIGLTIFAFGNSLADLVANMSVAVFAPNMGFSACFGGPMLNILLGIGFSGTYIIRQTSMPYAIHFSTSLLVSTIGLLVLLTATLVFVPLNDYMLTRRWGILLIASYTILMTVNIIVEAKSEARK